MIRVQRLSKRFRLYRRPSSRLKELVLRRPFHHVHQALDDVSFQVPDGETLGIIGQNGAGKSTLLKLLTGVLLPDSGTIEVNGSVTGLLELGTGFNMELSGIQNLYNNGMLLGMSPEEIRKKKEAIIDFTELGDFITEPMKTYSSGMTMRLAFAVAIHADPRCFLVDEALSVGDAHFQQKCMARIRAFRAGGGSIIFVSHDMNAIKMLCDRAILLDHGKIVASGDPEDVVNRYNHLIARLGGDVPHVLEAEGRMSYGTLEVEITDVEVIGERSCASTVSAGEQTDIRVRCKANVDVEDATVGIMLRDKFGQDIFGTNSRLLNRAVPLSAGGCYEVTFRLRMDIGIGKYTVTAAVHADESHVHGCYHWCDRVAVFEVAGILGERFAGICRLTPSLQITQDRDSGSDRVAAAETVRRQTTGS